MPALTLNQAAKAAKKSKSTLLEAIENGRLSAERDTKNQWQIDPAELFRVYPANQSNTSTENQNRPHQEPQEPPINQQNIDVLRLQIVTLEADLAKEKTERERERANLEARINRETANADHWRQQSTNLLTYQPKTRSPWPVVLAVGFSVASMLAALVFVVLRTTGGNPS